jgi:hypothetical protein
MARIKKALPIFETEEEEAEYWEKHSISEHFDELDFKPLQAKAPKDTPMTIRLDSESRERLEEVARIHKVGPSTLARVFIINALENWRRRQQISLTMEDTVNVLVRPMSDEFKQEAERLFKESKAGSLYILPESELERLSSIFIRNFFEAAGVRIMADDELPINENKRSHITETTSSR